MHRTLGIMGGLLWGFACSAPPPDPVRTVEPVVRPGLDVLLEDSMHLVRGRRVGLVTNQGGVDRAGVHGVERLLGASVPLVALFSPEHGFRGTAAPGEAVATMRDSATGLPIYSLYGRTSAPSGAMLDSVEVLLVDLPDVGARYYTYISTTLEVLKAAAARGIPVIVLDRPNPIGGPVQGNVLDPAHRSFVGFLAVPMRHGLTLGELTRLGQRDLELGGTLVVVPAAGWRRDLALDQAGLPFVRPSPNLKSLESLFHYPGTCLFEGTNLSVGRGTEAPFEQLGAPWLDTTRVLAGLRGANLGGVRFHSVTFRPETPGDGKHPGVLVQGIRLSVTDRAAYDPTVTALVLLDLVRRLHPDQFQWQAAQFDRLAGGPRLREQLTAGRAPAEIAAEWAEERAGYLERRKAFLIY